MITQDHLVQIKGSNFVSGVQNPSEEVDLITFEERDSEGFCWRRCGDMPTVLGWRYRELLLGLASGFPYLRLGSGFGTHP